MYINDNLLFVELEDITLADTLLYVSVEKW